MHPFTSFIAFPSQNFFQNMRTTWFFNDFSQGRKKNAISKWKDPSEIKMLSNVGFSSAWICIANFAISRSYGTEMYFFDFLMLSLVISTLSLPLLMLMLETGWFVEGTIFFERSCFVDYTWRSIQPTLVLNALRHLILIYHALQT